MKNILFALIICFAIVGCGSGSGSLYDLAAKQLPIALDYEMREYMQSVEKPVIRDLETIYDCDSICVLQCKAFVRVADGTGRKETVRYFFMKDTYLSAASQTPVYGDFISGGKYLDKKGIAAFREDMKKGGTKRYVYYLGMISPVKMPHE